MQIPVDDTTARLLGLLAKHYREEPGEANGQMPLGMQHEVARRHDAWDQQTGALRMLVGVRLTTAALDALEDQ